VPSRHLHGMQPQNGRGTMEEAGRPAHTIRSLPRSREAGTNLLLPAMAMHGVV
jgi:hypothetical protein